MAKRKTIRELERTITDLRLDIGELTCTNEQLRWDLQQAEKRVQAADASTEKLRELGAAHQRVLLGDRDVLTRALEVCTRRLASPAADRDPVRAGWRALQAESSPINQKAESHG